MPKAFKISNNAEQRKCDLSGTVAGSMILWWKAYATFVAEECSTEQQHKMTDHFNEALSDAGITVSEDMLIQIAQQANNGFTTLNDWLNQNFEGEFFSDLS